MHHRKVLNVSKLGQPVGTLTIYMVEDVLYDEETATVRKCVMDSRLV
jgi:hypothetical protein